MLNHNPEETREQRLQKWHNFKGESHKARERRIKSGWFDRYIQEPIIDIGCGNDHITETATRWDMAQGDAHNIELPPESFATVYASHILEHLAAPLQAIDNWWRLLKPGGRLILLVPHRDLYEKKKTLPSNWSPVHIRMYLPDRKEDPDTNSLFHTVQMALGQKYIFERLCVEDVGWEPVEGHPVGEYTVEMIIRKPLS